MQLEEPLKTLYKTSKILAVGVVTLVIFAVTAHATPSTTYWTPMTPDIQGYFVPHIGVDNYFTVGRSSRNGSGSFPTDVGFTMGVLPFEKLQMEVGIDYLQPYDFPFCYNAKVGSPENALFKGSPALYVGFFNGGFGHYIPNNSTSANIWYGAVGKAIPFIGRLSMGPYIGDRKVMVDRDGDKANTGFMFAFDHGFVPVKDKEGNEFNRLVLAADYATGKNLLGGGGVGLYYYFTKDISLLSGPVWFNEQAINGKRKWTMQLDINLPALNKWF